MHKPRTLLFVWGFLVSCLLAAGVVSIVASVIFTRPGRLILNLVVDKFDFRIGIALGGTYILAVLLSIPAILQPKEKSMLLKVLNWYLVGAAAATVTIGSILWVFSLQQLAEFSVIWGQAGAATQQAIQDKFSCCGYWNGTLAGQFTTQTGFCLDATFAANQTGCISAITSSTSGSDFDLENIFSSIYGFVAIIVGLFLATVCVINERKIEIRFARIDEKRGGGGFV